MWENRDLGEPGPKLLAPRPRRSGPGKNSFSLLVNLLFVIIFCCLRSGIISIPDGTQQIEEESEIMTDDFLSLVESGRVSLGSITITGSWLI